MERYAAKLLFQYRVRIGEENNKRRICEERIINVKAAGPEEALDHINKYGKAEQSSYFNNEGNKVFYEFVGIMDMMHLGNEAGAEEVLYEIKEYLTPKERKEKFVPKRKDLKVFKEFKL